MGKKLPIINEILKKNRKNMGITQEKLAELIFKSLGTVKRYDTGDIIPEATIIKLCEVLNTELISLLTIQETQNKLDRENFYENLIIKYSKNIQKFKSEYYNLPGILEELAKNILDLYKNFYNTSILTKNKMTVLKYPSYRYFYEVVEENIFIFRIGVSLTGDNKEKEILATFNYESANAFLEDIKLFFNFEHFKFINKK